MCRKISVISLFMLFTSSLDLYSQDQFNTDHFFCRLINKDSNAPVFYATIRLAGTNRGLISDDQGEFRLPEDLISYTLSISAIGYKTKKVSVSTFKKEGINTIYLEPNIEELEEVTLTSGQKKIKKIKKMTVKQIVETALNSISKNYPDTPFSYIAYYRDYQQPADTVYSILSNQNGSVKYLNLNEGILEVFDAGFHTNLLEDDNNQTLLYGYHPNNDFIRDSMLTIPYDNYRNKYLKNVIIPPFGGNELKLLQLTNALRNYDQPSFSFVETLKKDFIKNHRFQLKGISYLDSVPIYKIDIATKLGEIGSEHYGKGTIFISKKEFAIHKLEYAVYNSKKKQVIYTVAIEYNRYKDKMYLNYITFNNRFQVNSNQYFKVQKVTFDANKNTFNIHFDRPLDISYRINYKRAIKIMYKKRKVKIKRVAVFSDYIKVYVDKEQTSLFEDFNRNSLQEDFELNVSGVKDARGSEIGKMPKLFLNQYREIFVQEVFPGKEIEEGTKPMDKSLPMSQSQLNTFDEKNKYWENTPLKQSKKIN